MNNLKTIRLIRGFTRESLAQKTGIKERTVAAWEREEVPLENASYINILRLSKALDVEPMDLMGGGILEKL